MSTSAYHRGVRVLSGEQRGLGASLLRGVLAAAEPFYATAMAARNRAYDRSILPVHRLPRPVLSVGNLTAGGTGKTPVVQWLARRLCEAGHRPAVLLRGYKRAAGISDEQAMLTDALAGCAVVHAQPDRVAGGKAVLQDHPQTDVFVLDDGFQHRRLWRDFDLVLIDCTAPFGFGHVHPRGLLREPLAGLGRAHAILLTRSDQVTAGRRREIESAIRRHNRHAPLFACNHAHAGVRLADGSDAPLDALAGRRFVVFAGIANPSALESRLAGLPGECVACRWFDDHHVYSDGELTSLRDTPGADVLLCTEKDWVKVRSLPAAAGAPIWRLRLEVRFEADHERQLLALLLSAVQP